MIFVAARNEASASWSWSFAAARVSSFFSWRKSFRFTDQPPFASHGAGPSGSM